MKKRNNSKKKGGGLSELLVVAAATLATEFIPGVNAVVNSVGIVVVVCFVVWWVGKRLFGRKSGGGRARRMSAPDRMSRKAGTAFYNGAMDWMKPKQPTQYEQEIKARDEARKKYAWHEQQARKYAGTSDGAWHEQRMKELWNKMR